MVPTACLILPKELFFRLAVVALPASMPDTERMDTRLEKLSVIAAGYAEGQETPTAIPGLTIWFSSCLTEPTPAMFEPSIYLLLQGAKRMVIGSKAFDFAPGSLSFSAVGLPFTGQVIEASPDAPYVAVRLKFNAGMVTSLLLDMPESSQPDIPAATVIRVSDDVIEPFHRLLRLLSSPGDIPVLAPMIERELYYRLLQSDVGYALRQTVQAHTRFSQIKTAVEWICSNATMPMSVDALARSVGMSLTSFHRHFKTVTGLSPLAYQRHVRLLYAQRLLNADINSVTAVAFEVGYANASQFSREYTRMFGRPPVRDTLRSRQAASTRRAHAPSQPAESY
jgi:AraC-like DNA-binding protein